MATTIGVIFTPRGEYFFHDDFSWTTNGTDDTSAGILADIQMFMKKDVITSPWVGDPVPAAFQQVLEHVQRQFRSAYGVSAPPPVVSFHDDPDVVY